jgi:hypothetical protein
MRLLPSPNNVYGALFSTTSLQKVADVLRSRLGLTAAEVFVCKSEGESHETLYIKTAEYEFDTHQVGEANIWSFSGSVAGNRSEILMLLKYLFDPLHFAGYKTKFEIYDEEFNCIAEYRSHPDF